VGETVTLGKETTVHSQHHSIQNVRFREHRIRMSSVPVEQRMVGAYRVRAKCNSST
jgi:hypothetical protein